ncbi:unnamed protein product [Leptosia nina]|uniref:Uncharacterized protein n=1 Tax=Leptosia nina TaxID=320188 RepID=A0AAV1K2D9_9NEOP
METGCNDSIMDGKIIPAGYQIIWCDRTDGRGAFLVAARDSRIQRVSRCELDDVTVDRHSFELLCDFNLYSTSEVVRNYKLVLCSSYWWDKVFMKEADEPLVLLDLYHPPFVIELHYPRCTRIRRAAGMVLDTQARSTHHDGHVLFKVLRGITCDPMVLQANSFSSTPSVPREQNLCIIPQLCDTSHS